MFCMAPIRRSASYLHYSSTLAKHERVMHSISRSHGPQSHVPAAAGGDHHAHALGLGVNLMSTVTGPASQQQQQQQLMLNKAKRSQSPAALVSGVPPGVGQARKRSRAR